MSIRASVVAFASLAAALLGASPGTALALPFDRSDVGVGDDPAGIVAGPIDGDGIRDLAVTNLLGNSVSVLLGRPGGGVTRQDVVVGEAPRDVAIGRFNGDAHPDIAVACGSGVVSILLAKDEGYKRRDVKTRGAANGLAVGQLTGNRKTDIAVANAFRARQRSVSVEILKGRPRGRFKRKQAIRYGVGGGEPSDVAVGRFNGDRRNDLAVSTSDDGFGGGGADVLLAKRRGKFRVPDNFGGGSGSTAVGVGLLDGDQEQDIVVTSPGGFNRLGLFDSGGVEVLLGRGDGSFSRGADYVTGEEAAPIDTALADLDRDGTLDLATSDAAQDLVAVRLGDGAGTFPTELDVAVGSAPWGVAATDLSGDGSADLAAANNADDDVSVLINR